MYRGRYHHWLTGLSRVSLEQEAMELKAQRDALLAVVKAADTHDVPEEGYSRAAAVDARLRDLDAAHPGWREWAP